MKIKGAEGMSPENIRDEVNRGGRLVVYVYCVSVVVLTFKRATSVQLVKAGQSRAGAGWPWLLVSAVCGWWGFPWGPIYTIECFYRNLCGGVDVTDSVLNAITPASPSLASAAPPARPAPTSFVEPPAPKRGFNWKVAGLLAGGAAALAAIGVSAYCYHQQQHLTVVLANGLDHPYRIVLNGETHTLPAFGARVLELPEGEFSLRDAARRPCCRPGATRHLCQTPARPSVRRQRRRDQSRPVRVSC